MLLKLPLLGVPKRLLIIIINVFQSSKIIIGDEGTERARIQQMTGFARTDNLNPILFSVLVADPPNRIQSCHYATKIAMNGDVLILYSGISHTG